MAMHGITATGSLTAAGQRIKESGKKLKAKKPTADGSLIKPGVKYTVKKTAQEATEETAKTGILGKLKELPGKAWGLAKAHPVAAGAIAVVAGILGISAIAKKSKAKKAEGIDTQA